VKTRDVPQDAGLFEGDQALGYAVDDQGRYVMVATTGWEPVNLANQQAWEEIRANVAAVLRRVRAGELSPIAYHMTVRLMEPSLLAAYVGMWTWQVRRHMKAGPFRRLGADARRRYADVFKIPVGELDRIPDETATP